MKNNIFKYATGELSQDAFICWLMSYAMSDSEIDDGLTECARDFIRQFIPDFPQEETPYVTRIQRQYKFIDVLVTVNDQYIIVIEDKTFTKEHDDQLTKYLNLIKEENPQKRVYGVFFKIGFQGNLSNVKKSHYLPYGREKILQTMGKYISLVTNRIFLDYYEYVDNFNQQASLFQTKKISEWDWQQINGFYDYINKNIQSFNMRNMKSDYGYVANPSGGFYGMWLCNDTYKFVEDSKYELYIQLEFVGGNLNICYKASVKDKGQKLTGDIRDRLIWVKNNNEWINIADKYNFTKPNRFGAGNTVTLGIYKSNFDTYTEAVTTLEEAVDNFIQLVKELD